MRRNDDHRQRDDGGDHPAAGLNSARRSPTILDVASRAGVSKSTVSNVIRGVIGVSEDTRSKVESAIKQLGYRPNNLARQLVQQRTNILGVIVGDLANPFFAEMAKSVERHAAGRGYTAMFCNTEGDSQSELAGIETLLAQRVAGMVFLAFSGDSRTMRETLQHHVPAVFLGCHEDWGDVVAVDDELGGRLATRHLIEAGHRRLAFLSIPELSDSSDQARYVGFLSEAETAGVSVTRISWSPPADHAEINGAVAELRDAFAGEGRITGIFASNDVAAVALMEFGDRVGLRVPADLSIVGFDDVPIAGLARIALTTVAQPRDELARKGIDTIIDRIEGRLKGRPMTARVGVRLVLRRSTSAPAIVPPTVQASPPGR
jgi:LacI family transcriptional regulator, galactose operon repressor